MISKPAIITTAACPTCCAFIGEPCTFTRVEDPYGRRMGARQSHVARISLARDRAKKPAHDVQKMIASLKI